MALAEQDQVRATGGCLCGAIRYTVRGPLRGIILCHCGQCRRWHGHLGAYTAAARAHVTLEDAAALVWFASSERGGRGFCASCGSSLFFEAIGEARLAIAAGSLDQPSGLELIRHEYIADKADYVRTDDHLPACAGDFRAEGQGAWRLCIRSPGSTPDRGDRTPHRRPAGRRVSRRERGGSS